VLNVNLMSDVSLCQSMTFQTPSLAHHSACSFSFIVLGPEKVMVEKVEIEGADKRMQTAASATLETTEGCPQREDDQKENQPDSNNDEDYKLEKEGYG